MKLGYKWDIILKKNDGSHFENIDLNSFTEVGVEEGRFIADPFLYKKNGINYIFYESCDYKKGKIVISTINDDLTISNTKDVLVMDKHLSFPFLIEYDDDLYMIPESCKMNKIYILKCESFPDKWVIKNEIDLPGKDTTIVELDGLYYMFTTIGKNNNLSIFYSDNILGKWFKHSSRDYLQFKSKRNAGKIFRNNDDIIRPTQYDISEYGESISFNKIEIDEKNFNESEIINYKSILPNTVGLHHYDENEDFILMDINKKINYNQKKYTN